MPEEAPEKPNTSRQISEGLASLRIERRASFLLKLVIAASLLILILVGLMIGLLVYGIFSGSGIALIGSLLCLAGCLVIIGLVALAFKVAGIPKEQMNAAMASGRETYARVKEDLSARYERAKYGEF